MEKEIFDEDVEVEKEVFEEDVDVEKVILDDDVCDSMAQDVGTSSPSPDVEKQDDVEASLVGEVDEVPGGNVETSRRSPRFRYTNA